MPECVSCGKEISAGRLFCDDCYKNMKGKLGPKQPAKPEDSMTAAGTGSRIEDGIVQGLPPELAQKSPVGALTPSSSKKIVSLKPDVDKLTKTKDKGAKKKFSVTITMSERSYKALDRIRGKKKAPEDEKPIVQAQPLAVRAPRRLGKTGPHGRARLKAVEAARRKSGETHSRFFEMVGYRDRPLDVQDHASILIASVAGAAILALSFMGWMRIRWVGEGGIVGQEVKVKGSDFTALFYILVAVVAFSLIYMATTLALRRPLIKVDFGVTLLIAGIALIAIVFAALSSHNYTLQIALRSLERAGNNIQANALYERETIWPAYLVVLLGAATAFAGLIRLASRPEGSSQPRGNTKKA
jgi:hypothetical protein